MSLSIDLGVGVPEKLEDFVAVDLDGKSKSEKFIILIILVEKNYSWVNILWLLGV